jgi:hypothetical protein
MRMSRLVLVFTWITSLFAVGLWAQQRPAPTIRPGQPHGEILSGENIGFQRIAGPPDRDGRISGRLMVRIDGEWREVTFPAGIVRTVK